MILEGKVAIITGASSGIGLAAAHLFASEGARVIVTARRAKLLDEVVAQIYASGGTAVALPGDIRDETHASALVELAVGEYGGLDIAFNNAGSLGAMGSVDDISLDGWDETIETNLNSAFLGAKYQVPAMIERGGGSIVFTSSFVGYTLGMPGMAAYGAAKAGVVGLMKVLAAQYGPQGVRTNAILAGGTDTPMGAIVANTPEALSFVEGLHALKRIAEPEEIARSALFLASDAASFMNGAAVSVDGGLSITRV